MKSQLNELCLVYDHMTYMDYMDPNAKELNSSEVISIAFSTCEKIEVFCSYFNCLHVVEALHKLNLHIPTCNI